MLMMYPGLPLVSRTTTFEERSVKDYIRFLGSHLCEKYLPVICIHYYIQLIRTNILVFAKLTLAISDSV